MLPLREFEPLKPHWAVHFLQNRNGRTNEHFLWKNNTGKSLVLKQIYVYYLIGINLRNTVRRMLERHYLLKSSRGGFFFLYADIALINPTQSSCSIDPSFFSFAPSSQRNEINGKGNTNTQIYIYYFQLSGISLNFSMVKQNLLIYKWWFKISWLTSAIVFFQSSI